MTTEGGKSTCFSPNDRRWQHYIVSWQSDKHTRGIKVKHDSFSFFGFLLMSMEIICDRPQGWQYGNRQPSYGPKFSNMAMASLEAVAV